MGRLSHSAQGVVLGLRKRPYWGSIWGLPVGPSALDFVYGPQVCSDRRRGTHICKCLPHAHTLLWDWGLCGVHEGRLPGGGDTHRLDGEQEQCSAERLGTREMEVGEIKGSEWGVGHAG